MREKKLAVIVQHSRYTRNMKNNIIRKSNASLKTPFKKIATTTKLESYQ